MKCPKCGSECKDVQKFCTNCAAPLHAEPVCSKCGKKCAETDKFCDQCGTSLSLKPETEKHLIEEPAAVIKPASVTLGVQEEGYRKHVTVLITDIKGSTEMIRNLDPEEAKEILFPAIQKLSSIVYEFSGMVISTAGDGLVAVFGAPQTLEDHGLRACLAALAMQKQIASIHAAIQLRVGLDTGEVLLALNGTKFDIAGSVVHLAARMEQTAVPGTIRLTKNTLQLVSDSIATESLGKLEIKGFADLVEVFELKGIKVSKSFNEWESQFVGRARFVNREKEIAKVISLLNLAKEGNGNAVSLCSEFGFGKSRFTYEIIKKPEASEFSVLLTAAFIHTKDIPLLPVKNLFRSMFGISREDTDIESIKKLITPFVAFDNTSLSMNAALNLIDFPPTTPEWSALEPGLRRKYMFEVGAKIILMHAKTKPLIIIFEDIHWVDKETELFMDMLISLIAKSKIFILISYRPEYHDHWSNKTNYTRMLIDPLSPEAGSAMIDNLLGDNPSLTKIKMKLLSTIEGNPYFLEELVHALVGKKILIGEPKHYSLSEGVSVPDLHLPETIVTIFQMKMDSLSPVEKNVLQIASVIGTTFVYSDLIQLMDNPDEGEVRAALNKLVEKQYIYEGQLYPELVFTFTHALGGEIAYNSLLKKTRKSLHMKFIQILESSPDKDQAEQMQIIATHANLAEDWVKAFYYSVTSAEKVYEINAFSTAAKLCEQALLVAVHLPQDETMVHRIMELHYSLYYIYVPLGMFKEQYAHLEKAMAIALDTKDRVFESLIESAYCIHYMGYKKISEAYQHAEKALTIARELKYVDAIAIAQFALVHTHFFMAEFDKLFAVYKELEETVGNNLDFRTKWLKLPIIQIARLYESWGRAAAGDFATIDARKESWFAGSKDLTEPNISNICRFAAMGVSFYMRGEYQQSATFITPALQYSMSTEVLVFVPIFLSVLSGFHAHANKIPEAKELIGRAVAVIEKMHGHYVAVASLMTISEVMYWVGDFAQGKEFCDKGIIAVKEREIYGVYCFLARLSADFDLALPNPNLPEIKKKIEEAFEISQKYTLRFNYGHCHLTFSRFYEKMGDTENRKKELQLALADYEKYGMTGWVKYIKEIKI